MPRRPSAVQQKEIDRINAVIDAVRTEVPPDVDLVEDVDEEGTPRIVGRRAVPPAPLAIPSNDQPEGD